MLNNVVLPAPFGPISPKISPVSTANDTSLTATTPPKRRETCSACSATTGRLVCTAPGRGGCVMVVPSLFELVALRLGGIVNRANNIGLRAGSGNLGGLVLGMTLGIVWTPCAGPVLGSILTLVASSQSPAKGATLLVAYAIGASIPMMMIAYGGQYIVGHVRGLTSYTQQIQQGFGVVVVLVSAALYLQYDVLINAWLLDLAPSLTIGI